MVYEKTKHFHGLIFRKPSLPLQSLTMARAREEDDNQSSIERMFYILLQRPRQLKNYPGIPGI